MDSATPYMPERSEDLTTNAFRIALGSCILAPIFASARKRNFMNPVFLFLSALLFFAPVAEAVSWHTLQTSAQMTLQAGEPLVEAMDKNAADQEKKKAKKLKIWDKTTYSRPQQARPGDFYYTSAKSLAEINCTAHTLKLLQKIYYDSDGNEIKSVQYDAKDRDKAVVPDTSNESVFNFACAFKAAKPVANSKKTSESKPGTSTEKTKGTQKPQATDNTKASTQPAPVPPPAKPADTKK